ncbi:MAG: hypothetical protein FWF08_04850, partial [Oscillospiraceae bacterium]|nr:hypothetical protein [Oscillospiraceae bacterium]
RHVILAENPKADNPYLVCNIRTDNPLGLEERYNGSVTDNYVKAIREFSNRVDGLAAELAEKRSELAALEKSVNEFKANEMNEYVALYAQLKRSRDAFEIRRYGTRYGDTFMLIGWIPAKDKKIFIRYMDNFDAVEYKFENPENAGSLKPPVKLKNLKIFKPFEYYVEMFGVPGYSEIDPTPFVALTYTLLYGIMFADVGQGLVLSLAGYLMYKIKGMALGKILVPCGISGSFFGLVFGSVFGYEHVLDGFYKALGFSEKPIHVMGAIMPILFTGIGIGVALMFIAIIISIYSNFKRGHPGEAVFGENGICGLIIYASVITLLLSVFVPMFAPGFAPVFTPVIKPVMPYVASSIAISLCILLFKEPLSHIIEKKPLKMSGMGQYLTQSFFEVFESFLSYITNTVSFLRVGAFVFVHAGMMMVFSTLSEMFGGGIAGAVIMIFGNMLVLALEGLLVGVQSLRLEFYEMFSRFFKGDGKPYRPITLNLHNQNIN